jgi:ABC-type polysaccharide/polyol phosphate transport system ATPase subunit
MKKIELNNICLSFIRRDKAAGTLKELFAEFILKNKENKIKVFKALNNINLNFYDGDRVGIIGKNGAGKSTLLKTIAGIYKPSAGEIKINGRIAPLLEVGAGFHPEFTGRENIYFNGALLGYSRAEIKQIEGEVLSFSGLENFAEMPVKNYSTGMYMKLAFSLATTYNPDILILDELFVGGDFEFVRRGKKRINAMIDRSNVMILVSHDSNLLRELCSKIVWIENGSIRDIGDCSLIDQYEMS